MRQQSAAQGTHPAAKISTEEVAARLLVQPQTVRRSLCVNGEYMGLRPVKLPSRRLLWDAAEVERLISGEGAK